MILRICAEDKAASIRIVDFCANKVSESCVLNEWRHIKANLEFILG